MSSDREEMPPHIAAFAKRYPQKFNDIAGLTKAVAPVIGDFIVKAVEPVIAENARLSGVLAEQQKRLDELEARPVLKYCGVWAVDKVYSTGNFVTDAGSVWHAQRANAGARPGVSDAWVLAVKKGKDAR
jgi:hypothetical protein